MISRIRHVTSPIWSHIDWLAGPKIRIVSLSFVKLKMDKTFKVQMKCFFFIAEFERAAKIRKIAVYRFLISPLVPEL